MLKLEELIIDASSSILDTMKKLDETGQRILFIAPDGMLQAVLTDGDLRKFLLRGGALTDPVQKAANYTPHTLLVTERGRARALFETLAIDALPILDKAGKLIDVVFATGLDIDNRKRADIPVVIMAGGLGTRLYPYTKILPKPLIPIGEKPIVEMIIDRFCGFGCKKFYMVVNYKKNMIKSYFNDLEHQNYEIEFIDEAEFLGTGGGLCLLKDKINEPFFFSNCDTLLDVDYGDIYHHHQKKQNVITMICAYKHYVVPYGVVEMGESGSIEAMREKPELNFLTNTGVYLVNPNVVAELEDGKKQGFPDVIEKYRTAGGTVGIYPINESSWMDMGQMEELDKMRRKLEETKCL
ncbi:MAG: sugar phosphate nucleotidyltransferase [Faecalibacterium sp.]